MIFKNRYEAAMQLIPLLKEYEGKDVVVLAIPRGGVPIGYYIAREFNWTLDVLLTKKIGHPLNPELAIGSVSLEGEVIDPRFDSDKEYLTAEIKRIRETLKEKYVFFKGKQKPAELKNKTVMIVDDGIATGNTMLASVDVVRHHKPSQIIIVTPVAPPDTAERLEKKADRLVCLSTPRNFRAVGQFYSDFSEVSDEEVIAFLNEMK